MTARCEPPAELQGVDGWHWISAFHGPLFWDCEYYGWNTEEGDYTAPDDCPANWRYIAPVASPAEVDALRANVTGAAWQPIETAPRDGTVVLVWATLPDHAQWTDAEKRLPPIMRTTAWHPDAGWCVDELREATHWCPLPAGPRCDAT